VLPLFPIVVYRFVSSRKPFKEYLKFYSSFLFFYVNGFLGKPSLPDTGVSTIGLLFFTLGMAQLFGKLNPLKVGDSISLFDRSSISDSSQEILV